MVSSLVVWAVSFAAAVLAPQAQADREVFAHYMVGNTVSHSYQDFYNDVAKAASASIDGFALNIATDSWTENTLTQMYQAAENFNNAERRNFRLFISFDYAVNPNFDITSVTNMLNKYGSKSAQFKINGKTVASTFLGTGKQADWVTINAQANSMLIPDYSDADPAVTSTYSSVSGLLSWIAWPDHRATVPSQDNAYATALANNRKLYMMPVSPWFYANCYGKNWIWNTDDLWHLRWEQVFQVDPDYIEILTWNDWGESHYIAPNPIHQNEIPAGAENYVNSVVHDAWLNDLPYYIAKYKARGAEPAANSYTHHFTFWYRLNPKGACWDGGATCNSAMNGQATYPAGDCAKDQVSFTVFTDKVATVTVEIGGQNAGTLTARSAGIFHGSVPFNGKTGAVSITAKMNDGSTLGPVVGPQISNSCGLGYVNWNAWVGGS